MTVTLHQGDLPDGLDLGNCVAIDSETMGLKPVRDRLCLIQLSSGDGNAHLVQFKQGCYDAPNLKKLLTDPKVLKLFHFARFDIAALYTYLGVVTTPIYCTKIVSKLVRTFSSYHGLKHLCHDLIKVELDKQQQTTNWGAETLSPEQIQYAASDVLYLHRLKVVLDELLAREKRTHIAQACFDFLPTRSILDTMGWDEEDIFEH
jgi:ribonuclease D